MASIEEELPWVLGVVAAVGLVLVCFLAASVWESQRGMVTSPWRRVVTTGVVVLVGAPLMAITSSIVHLAVLLRWTESRLEAWLEWFAGRQQS